jgi:hypothetical protein
MPRTAPASKLALHLSSAPQEKSGTTTDATANVKALPSATRITTGTIAVVSAI